MKLLFDIGNSTVDWAIEDGKKFIQSGKFRYGTGRFIEQLEQNIEITTVPSAVLVSNVAGEELVNTLSDWVDRKWQLKIWQAEVTKSFSELKNSYQDIRQMGIDRWLAMIAAWTKFKSAICVVGCGTALTIDLIDKSGGHLGGYIIPGVEVMQQALITKTDKIKVTPMSDVSIAYANNTQAAINNGSCLAAVAMIDYCVEKLRNDLNIEPRCIITGGMAKQIKTYLQSSFDYEQNLVLQGLSIMHKASQ